MQSVSLSSTMVASLTISRAPSIRLRKTAIVTTVREEIEVATIVLVYSVLLSRLDRLTGLKSLFVFLTSRRKVERRRELTALWKLRYLRSCTGRIQSHEEAGTEGFASN